MIDKFLTEASPTDWLYMLSMAFGMGLVLMVPFIFVFGRTVALKKGPDKRATWTTALSYAGATLFFIFWGMELGSPLLAPFIPLPGAILVYFFLRNTYRKGWVEDEDVTDWSDIQNNDWRIGILTILGLLAIAALKVLLFR